MKLEMQSYDGIITLDTGLGGRIFASLGGEMLHRFDAALAASPVPGQFNNIGGNSLWPAPEGGPFGFNYHGNEWYVQAGIESVNPSPVPGEFPACRKDVELINRAETRLSVRMERFLRPGTHGNAAHRYALEYTGYRETGRIAFSEPCPEEKGLLAAWSLEQFTLTPDAVLFGRFAEGTDARKGINTDYYGDPYPRMTFDGPRFLFRPGGEDRQQIGLSANCAPEAIGAYIPEKRLAVLRLTKPVPGGRFCNIADNEQSDGIWSADDCFSMFNGGSLGFFELETIAPEAGAKGESVLESETLFVRGERSAIQTYLKEEWKIEF